MTTTRMSVLTLSRGSTWNPRPGEPPYLQAAIGDPWPDGADCYTVFTDTSGGELATIYADTVTTSAIRFLADPDDVDLIPAGANFETFLETDDGPVKIRYGKVVRREVEYVDAPATQLQSIALNYTDTFPTLGLRSNWKAISGRTKVYNNTGSSLPFGVSANATLFYARSAIRWDSPLNSDTAKSHVVLLNQGPGQCTVIICADQRLTSGLGVQFDSQANRIHLGVVTGPTSMTYKTSALTHTVADLNDYYVTYDDLTKLLAVYKGTDLTPLQTWADTLNEVPHGPGYRYAGFSFNTGLLFSPGVEVAGWQAKDN
jgi:hypothetical protein